MALKGAAERTGVPVNRAGILAVLPPERARVDFTVTVGLACSLRELLF